MKRTVLLKATPLEDVDVDLISLVNRPSSRVPFSIMKSEDAKGGNTMKGFDLNNLFAKSEAPTAPVVTSVIVKGEADQKMLDLLKEQGFSVEKAETKDGVTIYPQEVAYQGDVSVVKLTDNVAITIPVVKADGSFAEMCAAAGYYPSISIATDLLQCELYKAVEKSDSPTAAAAKVSSVVSDFGQFMSKLVGGLPEMVFKAEVEITKAAKKTKAAIAEDAKDGGADDDEEDANGNKIKKDASATGVQDTAKKIADGAENNGVDGNADSATALAADVGKTVVKAEDGTEIKDGTEVKADPVEKTEKVEAPVINVDEIAKSVAAALKPQLDEVKQSVTDLGTRVETVEGTVQKAAEAVNGTTLAGVFGTPIERTPVEKSDDESGPLIDTAFAFGKKGA